MNSIFLRITILFTITISFIACDKDSNEIGANIVGNDNYNYTKFDGSSIVAFTQKTGPIQSNNLDLNQLGIYDNKVFGKTISSFATQLQLTTLAPTFTGVNTVTSVVLNIPYSSTIMSTDANGRKTYSLNNITGDYKTAKIKLSIYKNGQTIYSPTDVFSGQILRNYSDQFNDLDAFKIMGSVGRLNNSTDISQNDAFMFSAAEIVDNPTTTPIYSAPAMRLTLDNSMGTEILNTTAVNLAKNDDFVRFYKGLFFKIEQVAGNEGCLALMNFKAGTVTINYNEVITTNGVPTAKSLVLNLTGNTINVFENVSSGTVYESLPNTSATAAVGDKKLYAKGGQGSVVLIDLFKNDTHGLNGLGGPNGISDIVDLKNSGWLINEANLVFNIDKTSNGMAPESYEPDRILLYDVQNKRPLLDYYSDATTNPLKGIHGGSIEKTSDTKGDRYKIRLTSHIRNLINNDSTNVRLGLSVTQNILNASFGRMKNAPLLNNNNQYFPNASTVSPLGTVLYGSNYLPSETDYDKRLKLEIWYTKPN